MKRSKKKPTEDMVNQPSHYKKGKFEVIDFLEDQFADRPHEWNAAKYLSRAPYKNNEIQDLEKSIWYIQRKIKFLKRQLAASEK